ncbi:hypothetical protein Y032_0700g1636 [Ancylostoma ceylanicum]|uniref:Uncharacterized protein n=3 Tax=Ancylostoma ceylanicum TaxID=53326 RepID=A0A016WI71_9BILA|nr:hypothetical protein Y032_0700g1636 [Ancylostoma ceylanicum]
MMKTKGDKNIGQHFSVYSIARTFLVLATAGKGFQHLSGGLKALGGDTPELYFRRIKSFVLPSCCALIRLTTTDLFEVAVQLHCHTRCFLQRPVHHNFQEKEEEEVIRVLLQCVYHDHSAPECGCGSWSEWVGECSQPCGGCGHRVRTRQCRRSNCRNEEKRPCNFAACPSGTNFLINNGEFHILWRGCCVGLFRSDNECTALETDQNPFFKIISALFSNQDSAHNRTDIPMKIPRGEH